VIEKLAFSLGRNDEAPNIELAKKLAASKNKKDIDEIADGLDSKTGQIAGDCIKVLYELAGITPELAAPYAEKFIGLLQSKNNRLVWGAMMALSKITALNPGLVCKNLDIIVKAYEKGSVITVDNSISVFAELAKAGKSYEKKAFPIIIKHLENCRPREVAQHSERAFACVNKGNAGEFKNTLLKRRSALTDPQKKRVDKLIKQLPVP